MAKEQPNLSVVWNKALGNDELAEGRVKTVVSAACARCA